MSYSDWSEIYNFSIEEMITVLSIPEGANIVSRGFILGDCAGSPGVRTRIVDRSMYDVFLSPTSIAGIVGYSTKGQFNKIIQIPSVEKLDSIIGTGFNSYKSNQGYYAARAVLNNGGFVEYVRPYGEEIDPDSNTNRELKSDTFLVSYDYNPLEVKSINIKHFAATKLKTDGYSTILEDNVQTATLSTIKLSLSASYTDDYYNDLFIDIIDGTGRGQSRTITDYLGSTRLAFIDTPWDTIPDSSSIFKVMTTGREIFNSSKALALNSNYDFSLNKPMTSTLVRLATIANIATLSGLLVVDGIQTAIGDRILVKNQTSGLQNGVYVVASGAWTRATDFDISSEFNNGDQIEVSIGVVNTDTLWELNISNTFVLDTDSVTFTNVLTSNEIALFSIINEDPSSTKRTLNMSDKNGDKLVVTPATYKIAKVVTQIIQFSDQPTDADAFSIITHDQSSVTFEFDNNSTVTTGNISVTIGSTILQTMNYLLTTLEATLSEHTFKIVGNSIEASIYFGIRDIYNPLVHDDIFTEIVDAGAVINIGTSTTDDSFLLIENTIGKIFLGLGLCTEKYVKETYTEDKKQKYILNSDGLDVAKIFLHIDYMYDSNFYSFYGTIIPFIHNTTDLYIINNAKAVENGFKFIINKNEDLEDSITSPNFNLGQSIEAITVNAASISNITLSGTQTIDGISLVVDDKVLVKNQSIGSMNGLYVVKSGVWERMPELDESSDFNNDILIKVLTGTININTNWRIVLTSDFIIDNNDISFYEPNINSLNENNPLITLSYKYAFDENDPAVIGNAIWEYVPSNIISTLVLSDAWKLFSNKDNSNADYLVSAGTNIKNLFIVNKSKASLKKSKELGNIERITTDTLEEIDYDVMESMLDVCNLRKDCFSIFDGVDELNIDSALLKMGDVGSFGVKGRWGSIFDGRSIFKDNFYTKMNTEVVKSVELAGLITKNRRGQMYWIPPAGQTYGTVPQTLSIKQKFLRKASHPEDMNSDIARLYDISINPSKTINNMTVIFGQKTLWKEDNKLNRLNVTMLVAGLHKLLQNILDSRMLKLNRMSLRNALSEQLRGLLGRIKSSNPAGLDGFTVICDGSNNTRDIIEQNKLIVDIEIEPSTTGECIILRTTVKQTDGTSSISGFEILGK